MELYDIINSEDINNINQIIENNPEKLLKTTIDEANLKRYRSTMFHFKIRSDGDPNVYYQLLKKYTTAQEYMNTITQYKAIILKISSKNKVQTKPCDDFFVSKKSNNVKVRKYKRRSCPH